MIEKYIESYAKDCAKNYENGVEFSVKFSLGPIQQITNVPRFTPELKTLSSSRKREFFKNLIYAFFEKADIVMGENDNGELHIQYLPLQADDFNTYTYINKQTHVVEPIEVSR